jgi:hypothetical protein
VKRCIVDSQNQCQATTDSGFHFPSGKKVISLPVSARRSWVVESDSDYSIRRQCRLAGITRSGFYYKPVPEKNENLLLMRLIDEQYMKHPEFGYPQMTDWLCGRDIVSAQSGWRV